jgi:hypothetical protein
VSWTFIQPRDSALSASGECMKAMLQHIARERVTSGEWQHARTIP